MENRMREGEEGLREGRGEETPALAIALIQGIKQQAPMCTPHV